MEDTKIITEEGIEQSVKGLFYLFDSKYCFIYTTGELDGEEYVKLYLVQVGKEIVNNNNVPMETGNMVGIEVSNKDDWKNIQHSITQIVEDKKNNTKSENIQYLPITMLTNLKIISKNKFKLLKSIIEQDFNLAFGNPTETLKVENEPTQATSVPLNSIVSNNAVDIPQDTGSISNDVIIDYRTKFFEEQEKNKSLEEQLNQLQEKLDSVKKIIE